MIHNLEFRQVSLQMANRISSNAYVCIVMLLLCFVVLGGIASVLDVQETLVLSDFRAALRNRNFSFSWNTSSFGYRYSTHADDLH